MVPIKICFLLIFFHCTFTRVLSEICTNSGYSYEKHLGSKTPYRIVANNTFGKLEYKGCKPLKLWMVVRHGTRTPNSNFIIKMRTRLFEIRDLILDNNPVASDYISNVQLDLFRKWDTKLTEDDSKKLTHEGENEILLLAERMQSRFPEVLDRVYSNTSYKFRYTASQRTKNSAKYFATGLFGKNTAKKVWYPKPSKKDPILRFYKLCKKWQDDVKRNPLILGERRKFEKSVTVQQAVSEINRRLQLADDELDFVDVHAMYMMCAFETAWNRRAKSPWCSPFTLDIFKIMEYAEDLQFYWVDGYGREITYKQACTTFNDMINMFKRKDKFPKVTVYFSHSGTLLKMLAHLGLYREDESLKADNFRENAEERLWRVGRIDPFGTNLAFVLYSCDKKDKERKILTLHQEQIVRLPSCPDRDLCDIKNVTSYYKSSIETCAFDEMCDNT